jgi:hypothetical protein
VLHFELGYEALTSQEAEKVVSNLFEAIYGSDAPLFTSYLEQGTLRFNYRRVVMRELAIKGLVQDLITYILKVARTSLSHKAIKWFLFFHNDDLVCCGSDAPRILETGTSLIGVGYGTNLIDTFQVSSFSNYLLMLEQRNVDLNQRLIINFPSHSRNLDGTPYIDTVEKELVIKNTLGHDGWLSYTICSKETYKSLFGRWLHYTHTHRILQGHFVQEGLRRDSLSYVYIREILDRHHSVKFLDTSSETDDIYGLLCNISTNQAVSDYKRVTDEWMNILRKRQHTFEALYVRDYDRLVIKIAEGIPNSDIDILNTFLTSKLLEKMNIDDTEVFSLNLDKGIYSGSLIIASHSYTPFTIYRLYEYTALSNAYPELREYIAMYLYRDLLEGIIVKDRLHASALDMFRHIVNNKKSPTATLVKVVSLGTHIIEIVRTNKINISKSLKSDPYQIRPLIKRYIATISSINLDFTYIEDCWHKAVKLELTTLANLECVVALHQLCLRKLYEGLTIASDHTKPETYLDPANQYNPYVLVLTQQSIKKYLFEYKLLLGLVDRISNMCGSFADVSDLTLDEQEILDITTLCLYNAVVLHKKIESYLKNNLILHKDLSITSHRKGFMSMVHRDILDAIKVIHTL